MLVKRRHACANGCCDTVSNDASALLQINPLFCNWCLTHCSMSVSLKVGIGNVLLSIQAKRWEGSEVKTDSYFPLEN